MVQEAITFQPEFHPALPCVFRSKDYREFRAVLVEMTHPRQRKDGKKVGKMVLRPMKKLMKTI